MCLVSRHEIKQQQAKFPFRPHCAEYIINGDVFFAGDTFYSPLDETLMTDDRRTPMFDCQKTAPVDSSANAAFREICLRVIPFTIEIK